MAHINSQGQPCTCAFTKRLNQHRVAVLEQNPLPQHLEDNWLTWEPGREGKGFILDNGRVWHWPTEDQHPMHLNRSAPVKALGGNVRSETAFHITPEGGVYQVGPGRQLDLMDIARLNMADHRLKAVSAPADAEGYGHAQEIYNKMGSEWTFLDHTNNEGQYVGNGQEATHTRRTPSEEAWTLR